MTNHRHGLSQLKPVIESEQFIASADLDVGTNNLLHHPDGSLWLNTTKPSPGLLTSRDLGKTWTAIPVDIQKSRREQFIAGLYITNDGCIWAIHQSDPTISSNIKNATTAFVSRSMNGGLNWETIPIDQSQFSPDSCHDPYTSIGIVDCHPNFIEGPDGTVMFSASMRYDDWDDYGQHDQTRPGIRDVMVRTTDFGLTWRNPTVVHQHATETSFAVNPVNPQHIIAATRLQRHPLPGEDANTIKKKLSGVPDSLDSEHPWVLSGHSSVIPFCYKNGMLTESIDGGLTFRERFHGLYGYMSYRWSTVWTEQNILILVSFAGREPGEPIRVSDRDHVARISLDGGLTWLNGTSTGTNKPNNACKFTLVKARSKTDYSDRLAATIQLAPNRFMTMFRYKKERKLKALYWHISNLT